MDFTDAYDLAPNQRSAQITDLEVTSFKDGILFDGFAAVFNEPTDLGDFTEEFRHGAFRKVLATGQNVPLLAEHDPNMLLGTTKSGRVRLTEETRGLRVQANLAETDLSRRVKALAEAGDIKGMSVGFVVGRGNADWQRNGAKRHRIIKGLAKLLDVCTTWDPAYAGAEAQFRSLALANPENADALQQFLTGRYWQLEEQGDTEATPSEPDESETETRDSGVSAPLLAARKRRLALLTITLEGEPDA